MNYVIIFILIPPLIEDIKSREIRNIYWMMLIFVRCVQLFVERDKDLLADAGLGFAVVLIIMLLCFFLNKDGIGFGDVKLLVSLGFACGIKLILSVLFYVSLCSILFSTILLATKKVNRNTQIPFVPFIFVGTCVATLIEVIS